MISSLEYIEAVIDAYWKVATDEEVAEHGFDLDWLVKERKVVQRKVDLFTEEVARRMESEADSARRYDLDALRTADIRSLTLQPVRRSGSRYLTRCVFHEDSNPSCVLYPDGRGFFCFSCGEGGNAIDWVMREFGIEFVEACEYVGRMCG